MVINQVEALAVTSESSDEYALPATVAQEAFWYLDSLRPGNPAYNISIRFRIVGPLQPAVLERALAEVVGRHETLRTTFTVDDGELLQLISPLAGPVSFLLDDLRHDVDSGRSEAIAAEEASRGFDLESGPLFRARLLRLADAEYVLLVTVHHIVADGWSTGLIIDELAVLYAAFAAGCLPRLPPLRSSTATSPSGRLRCYGHRPLQPSLITGKNNSPRLNPSLSPTTRNSPPVRPHGARSSQSSCLAN